MIQDDFTKCADAQNVYSAGGSVDGDDEMDLTVDRNIHNGEPLDMVFEVTTDFDGAGNVTFEVLHDNNATPTTVVASSETVAYTAATDGTIYVVPVLGTGRYLNGQVTSSATTTAGAVTITVQRHGDVQSNLTG